MPRFELSKAALDDLEEIVGFTTQRWGKARARAYLDALEGRLMALCHQPNLGRRREDLAADLLSFPFESHVIFYRRARFGIVVVRLLHGRQDAVRHLG